MSTENNNGGAYTPKIYVGNMKEKARPSSGDKFLVGSICLTDFNNIPEEHKTEGKNGKIYVNVIINPFKQGPNQYGNTHSIAIDTYKPQNNNQNVNTSEGSERISSH